MLLIFHSVVINRIVIKRKFMLDLPEIISIDRKQELAECKHLHTFWSLAAGHWGHRLMLGVHNHEPSFEGSGR